MSIIKWFVTPPRGVQIKQKNFVFVQIDAIGIGLANAAAPFLPIFLARLGASNFQVGLLTSMPALTGLILAMIIGNYLQRKSNIITIFGTARLLVVMSYALTGLAPFFVPDDLLVYVILAIWALATLPQTIVSILFNVVMGAVTGPTGRFEVMSRRWSIMGFTTAIAVIIVGQVLDRIGFSVNYQVVFLSLSMGGLISYYFSSRLELPERPVQTGENIRMPILNKQFWRLIISEKPFINFAFRRFIYLSGISLAAPLIPLYYVRQLKATDAWISIFSTTATAVMIIGYFFWANRSRRIGTKKVMLWTTFGLSFYPVLLALNTRLEMVILLAAFSGIFQAGLDLVFFDELMRTIPPAYSPTFVSFAQSLVYLASVASPLVGTFIADTVGITAGLLFAGLVRLVGFILFITQKIIPDPLHTPVSN